MGAFLQYGNVYPEVQSTILSRAGNNLLVSGLKPWIRLTSAYSEGLVMASNLQDDTFGARYGDESTTINPNYPHSSGRIGVNFKGNSIYPRNDGFDRSNRPSPLIESISIANGTEGLSRKLTFSIKCFSLPQLDTITKYFLEPRFYLLAEWGFNTPESIKQKAKVTGVENIDDAVCECIGYANLSVLKDKRKNSSGTYDAFLGVITGGGVEYGDDETYTVNVEVTTQGEIPAYLQSHRGTVVNTTNGGKKEASSSEPFEIEDIEDAQEKKESGKELFMWMYNDLPKSKQIDKIKKWKDDPKWNAEYNFINMNKSLRDTLMSDLKDVKVKIKSKNGTTVEGKIPSDQPLIGQQRFIRMELAWEILNTTDLNLEPVEIGCKRNVNGTDGSNSSLNMKIGIDNTIVRAHKHMFSVNKSYLYLPNPQAPDFGLYHALTTNKENLEKRGILQFVSGNLVTQNLKPHFTPEDNIFPQPKECNQKGYGIFDDSYENVNQDPYEWGYLKDLYINFDFFCDCLQRNGYYVKDVALDMLNGLSQGVNMFWDFQIVEAGSVKKGTTGDYNMVVVDKNFSGKPPSNVIDKLFKVQSIGKTSPFHQFSIKLEVAGGIANQAMAQQNSINQGISGQSSYNNEDKVENFRGLFAYGPDHIGAKLNKIRRGTQQQAEEEAKKIEEQMKSEEEKHNESVKLLNDTYNKLAKDGKIPSVPGMFGSLQLQLGVGEVFKGNFSSGFGIIGDAFSNQFKQIKTVVSGETEKQKETRTTNYDFFMKRAGVYPKINNKDADFAKEWWDFKGSNDVTIDDNTMVCAVWEDVQLLRQVYDYDMGEGLINSQNSAKNNPGYLPIEVNFTIHGVSGIKVGDMIHFIDLPHVYRNKIFTVFNVEHSLNDDLWTTSILAKLRNIEVYELAQSKSQRKQERKEQSKKEADNAAILEYARVTGAPITILNNGGGE